MPTIYRTQAQELLAEAVQTNGEQCLDSFVAGLTMATELMKGEPELQVQGTVSLGWEVLQAVQALATRRQLDIELHGPERLMLPPTNRQDRKMVPGISFRCKGAIPECGMFVARNPLYGKDCGDEYFKRWEYMAVERATSFKPWTGLLAQDAEQAVILAKQWEDCADSRNPIWAVEGSFADETITYPDPVTAIVGELPSYIRNKLSQHLDDDGYTIWTWGDSLTGYTEADDRRKGPKTQQTKSLVVIALINDALKRVGLELSPTGNDAERVWGDLSVL